MMLGPQSSRSWLSGFLIFKIIVTRRILGRTIDEVVDATDSYTDLGIVDVTVVATISVVAVAAVSVTTA